MDNIGIAYNAEKSWPTAVVTSGECNGGCGSGHFLLAAARRLAAELARIDAGTDQPTEQHYRHAIRDVVRHCIYGVDLNPMAVELCKIGLWLESIEPGKPLSFLDAHIQNGNALVGLLDAKMLEAGIPADAYKPLTGDDKTVCSELRKQNNDALKITKAGAKLAISLRQIPQQLAAVEAMPEDTVEQVNAKRSAYSHATAQEDYQQQRLKEDLFAAAFFATKTVESADTVPTSAHLILLAEGHPLPEAMVENVSNLAREHSFFHWPLAFPQIFGEQGCGGFDVMLGNPPWDQLQYDPQEFFASRDSEIANAQHMSARQRKIDALETSNPNLYSQHRKMQYAVLCTQSFVHGSGRYPLTSFGRINLAPLFAELFSGAHSEAGYAGFIVPSGIATDSFTQVFFRHLAEEFHIKSLFDFENKDALFKGVHRSYKFCLMTLGDRIPESKFGFFLSQPQQILDPRRIFTLSGSDFELLNPNTRTCPVFRSNMDAEITKKIYRNSQILLREADDKNAEINPWRISFQLMFMMNTASHLFLTYREIEQQRGLIDGVKVSIGSKKYLPLCEAKMVHHYDHYWATYETDGETSRDCTLTEKQNPHYQTLPRYWVPENEVTLRTAKAPKPVLDAAKKQDHASLVEALSHWAAGYLLEFVGIEAAKTRLEQLLGEPVEQGGGDLFSQGLSELALQAQQMQSEHPMRPTEAEQLLSALEQQDDLWQALWPLLEVRRPKYLLGWRDICRATDERTVIAGVIPLSAVGDTFLLMYPQVSDKRLIACLLADQCSLPHDFIARQKIGGTHLKYNMKRQITNLAPHQYSDSDINFIVPRVLELTYTAYDLQPFAEDLGYHGEPFPFEPERRHQLKCELDAYYAKLYGLTRDELRYILDPTAVMGEDYPSETFRVLKNKELREFGEYRTQRLVLEAWDKLEAGELH